MSLPYTFPQKREDGILLRPVELKGHKFWSFKGINPLDKDSDFSYHDYDNNEHLKLYPIDGAAVPVNIRNLLGIDSHIRKNMQPTSSYIGQQPLKHA